MPPSINPDALTIPTVISTNVAQYDATLLSNRRRSFFREQFEQKWKSGRCQFFFFGNVDHRKSKRLKLQTKRLKLQTMFAIFLAIFFFDVSTIGMNMFYTSSTTLLSGMATAWVKCQSKYQNRTRPEFVISAFEKSNPLLVITPYPDLHPPELGRCLATMMIFRLWELWIKFPKGVWNRNSTSYNDLDITFESNNDLSQDRSLKPYDTDSIYGSKFKDMTFKPLLFSPFLQTKSNNSNPVIAISEFQLEQSNDLTKLQSIEANTASTCNTPIVVDTGATFGTTPYKEVLIPGTI